MSFVRQEELIWNILLYFERTVNIFYTTVVISALVSQEKTCAFTVSQYTTAAPFLRLINTPLTFISYPITGRYGPSRLQEVEASRISRKSANESGEVVSPTHRPSLPTGKFPSTHFCSRLSWPQGHNANRGIKSLKNSSDPIRNQTRDLPACSSVPQPRTLNKFRTLEAIPQLCSCF